MFEFYCWMGCRSKEGEEELRMTLRVIATAELARTCLDSEANPFMDDDVPEAFWEGKTWRGAVRGRVEDEEVEKWWTEGEK
jgi:hypothetical protein